MRARIPSKGTLLHFPRPAFLHKAYMVPADHAIVPLVEALGTLLQRKDSNKQMIICSGSITPNPPKTAPRGATVAIQVCSSALAGGLDGDRKKIASVPLATKSTRVQQFQLGTSVSTPIPIPTSTK
eukprot:CAMPEP_0174325210 /NCGR_PEP_ID=MMETSP0810-20121108/13097_1 /TAXON_ID=73025 ORGANISM="Eutreptiella gymnastica-like, Strain CCMP1594" /NCGR_SAMPLE_ID=MMETSP0810 /ASSEMBLY_ACC=CAM_ASM_000659 /LENGTH=125 /DNA_ID=CAMNT_0015438445 /DNA_START=209 /DNA_END=583 /DNA_ORIENTATION=+